MKGELGAAVVIMKLNGRWREAVRRTRSGVIMYDQVDPASLGGVLAARAPRTSRSLSQAVSVRGRRGLCKEGALAFRSTFREIF